MSSDASSHLGRELPGGVLVVDKPRGPTSHDVVARVRRALKTRHVGHAGTLDPMATGVLVVAVGEGTKLVPWLTADDKTYEATIRLGIETDTLDAEGRETARVPITGELARAVDAWKVGAELLEAALAAERSRTAQVPPAFSAIRIGGQRA
ncbi:MAG TPA: tRNA pseudouridine(55) synthase TruB, partial [Labilithrix sp.]|nr:tRNA pseudouridine(55) synthase TruB [Labilithrix sp.]